MGAEARLKELGIELPPLWAAPAGMNFRLAERSGALLFLAGHGPTRGRDLPATGKVGREVTLREGYDAARLTGLNLLATIRAELGSLDRVRRVVKLFGMVNSADDFVRQPEVINGASDLLIEVFGEAGRHARSAVGMRALPLGMPVEIEMIVELAG